MSHILTAYIRCVVGFALSVLVTAVWLSVLDASRPDRNTLEFPNPVHAFLFDLVIWRGLLNLVVSSGFALGIAPLLRYVPSLRLPLLMRLTPISGQLFCDFSGSAADATVRLR